MERRQIDVSVIIPTTGQRGGMMLRALESVRAQTLAPREILLVSDAVAPVSVGSPPGCRVVKTSGGRGASAARNLGALIARGRSLAFLDDDDAWLPNYLERCDERRDSDVVLSAFWKCTASGRVPEKVPPVKLGPRDFLIRNPGLRGSNLFIRAEMYQRAGGFDESLPALNDLDFGMRLFRLPGVGYHRIAERLVEFHAHSGPRLSTAGGAANRAGLKRFWELHCGEMTPEEADAFRKRALDLWGLDPRLLAEGAPR